MESASTGLLPVSLTQLGKRLAHAFEQRIADKFVDFATDDSLQDRTVIKSWGKRLCFSNLGKLNGYRDLLLKGLLLGDSVEAEKRYHTVQRLFDRGLLTGEYDDDDEFNDLSGDESSGSEVETSEESDDVSALSNAQVLLHFYEETPREDNRDFQTAAVFELLSLGLASLFQSLMEEIGRCGRASPTELTARFAGVEKVGLFWKSPWGSVLEGAPKARKLVQRLLDADDAILRGVIGGVLLGRVLLDRPLTALANDLDSNPALALVQETLRNRPDRSLAEAYPDLVQAMIERHEAVSLHKNRQRWCYLHDNVVVKDDLQEMQVGFHSLRFPQLYSLCRDLGLYASISCGICRAYSSAVPDPGHSTSGFLAIRGSANRPRAG